MLGKASHARSVKAPGTTAQERLYGCNPMRTSLGYLRPMTQHRRPPAIEALVRAFIRELTEAVESATTARARVLTEEYLRAAAAPQSRPEPKPRLASKLASPRNAEPAPALPVGVEPSGEVPPEQPRTARLRRKRQRPSVAAETRAVPTIDPEDERRAAELARIRAILRPAAPAPTALPVVAPPTQRVPEETDSLRVLEDRISDQIAGLAGLSQGRYTAQIAAWVGRVRLHQSGPESERTQIASRMLFEKLRNLAWSMEAGPIEALNVSWSTRNWEQYIHDNELIAATEDPPASPRPEADTYEAAWSGRDEAGQASTE
jgi:hypothetical protein